MQSSQPTTIFRSDYMAPNWRIVETRLVFELDPINTTVSSTLILQRVAEGPLTLDGVDLELLSLKLDGEVVQEERYQLSDTQLTIFELPAQCELQVVTQINPSDNKALEGLYLSGGHFCTQCEAQGFRKITYYMDRPDILAQFHVTVIADQARYPVLLSNGNLLSTEVFADGRHQAQWFDPFPKPSYLFALVAGELAQLEDRFMTRSGRSVQLFIYVESHNIDQCQFAMQALKRSMRWDEDVYGLEYDLDRFMIVAVDDFNMGAMENKGLNIFNSKYVLANEKTATDADFFGVEAVIAHEYFHNWTGNRVTCRDWFQLSLKEGLTVFRDQEFSSDMHSRTVKRIADVRLLRARQFTEDAGPTAHPIRPDSYIEINNFYTLTVYEKGAEVIRMLHTLLGAEVFQRGIAVYFERHDGQAVTCDDFVDAMQYASGIDLSQFKLWYSQAGTPQLDVEDHFDEQNQRYSLTVRQHTPDSPGQSNKVPMHIPMRMGLLNQHGTPIAISIGRPDTDGVVLDVTEAEQRFVFDGISEKPIPSLLRGFSAPVRLNYHYDNDTLVFLLAHDTDSFSRWEAGQRLAQQAIAQAMTNPKKAVDETTLAAFAQVINDNQADPAFVAEVLSIPSFDTIASGLEQVDVQAICGAIAVFKRAIANAFQAPLQQWIEQSQQATCVQTDAEDASIVTGLRARANVALSLLSELDSDQWLPQAQQHYQQASNMTDRIAALSALCQCPCAQRDAALSDFYDQWHQHKLVIDKWFAVQAMATHSQVLEDVMRLSEHADFDIDNPNRLRSLIGVFANSNPVQFHRADGEGYALLAQYIVRLDRSNPQVAARLMAPFMQWKRFVEPQRSGMQQALDKIANTENLSADVYEFVTKAKQQ